jgi:hypothetical protein
MLVKGMRGRNGGEKVTSLDEGLRLDTLRHQYDVLRDTRPGSLDESVDHSDDFIRDVGNHHAVAHDTSDSSREIRKLWKGKKSGDKVIRALDEQLAEAQKELDEVLVKRAALDRTGLKLSDDEHTKQSVTTSDGYTYEKAVQTYLTSAGIPTAAITIKVNGILVRPGPKEYRGADFAIALKCSSIVDNIVQNKYHDVLSQAKLQVEEEMKPKYAGLDTMPDADSRRASLDGERDGKIAEAEKKASTALKKFLNKYGGRDMDAQLLEELQWVRGSDAADREFSSRSKNAEEKIIGSMEDLENIKKAIDDKIQEIRRIIPSPSAHLSERHGLAEPGSASDEAASLFSLENFDVKIKEYMKHPIMERADNIYKQILSLASDERRYPEGLGGEEKKKIHRLLLEIGIKLADREKKMEEPFDSMEKRLRYSFAHYGKRLVYEKQLLDHMDRMAEAEKEHTTAVERQTYLLEQARKFYKGAGRTDLSPAFTSSSFHSFESALTQIQAETDQARLEQHIKKLSEQYSQIKDALKDKQLEKALEDLEKASLHVSETKGRYDELKVEKEKIEKMVEREKGQDDSGDAFMLDKIKEIKESDKVALQHLRNMELEIMKNFFSRKLEDQKAIIRKEEELHHFMISIKNGKLRHVMYKQHIKTMYWLALYGAGDQAALTVMGREAGGEFAAAMGLFK